MTDPISVIKIDLETLTEFQHGLHLANNEDEEIESRFSCEFKKTGWSTTMYMKLTSQAENDCEVVYEANNKFHYLLYTCLRQRLIALRVKEEYRDFIQICWPHNAFLNYTQRGQLCFDGVPAQTGDDIWFNIVNQFYMKKGSGKRKHFSNMIGNLEFLEEWTDSLPEFTIQFPQDWYYYSKNEGLAIPLFLCSQSRVTHRYKFRNNLADFLRMRFRKSKDAEWEEISYDPRLVEGAPSDGKLPLPELWGRYAYITGGELNWRKKEGISNNLIYIEDINAWSTEEPKTYNTPINIDLHMESPCKAMFWVAENLDASKNRNYSNFTTNTNNLREGWNPVSSCKLLYGNNERIPEYDSDIFDRMEPWYRFPSAPREPGYNGYSFSYNSGKIAADIGVVFKSPKLNLNAKLTLKLGDTDPFLRQIKDKRVDDNDKNILSIIEGLKRDEIRDDKKNPKFKVHARFLVMKKLHFVNGRCEIINPEAGIRLD